MCDKKITDSYDDGNIPDTDLPSGEDSSKTSSVKKAEPLPESSRSRKDGPGGD